MLNYDGSTKLSILSVIEIIGELHFLLLPNTAFYATSLQLKNFDCRCTTLLTLDISTYMSYLTYM